MEPLWTNFNEILIEIQTFSLKKDLQNGVHFALVAMC